MTDDLLVFLNARYDEEEALAERAGGREWHTGCECEGACHEYPACEQVEGEGFEIYSEGGHDIDQAAHIALHDPARVLREIAAKRDLIAFALKNAESVDGEWGDGHTADEIAAGECDDDGREALLAVLVPLAAVYGDRPT